MRELDSAMMIHVQHPKNAAGVTRSPTAVSSARPRKACGVAINSAMRRIKHVLSPLLSPNGIQYGATTNKNLRRQCGAIALINSFEETCLFSEIKRNINAKLSVSPLLRHSNPRVVSHAHSQKGHSNAHIDKFHLLYMHKISLFVLLHAYTYILNYKSHRYIQIHFNLFKH